MSNQSTKPSIQTHRKSWWLKVNSEGFPSPPPLSYPLIPLDSAIRPKPNQPIHPSINHRRCLPPSNRHIASGLKALATLWCHAVTGRQVVIGLVLRICQREAESTRESGGVELSWIWLRSKETGTPPKDLLHSNSSLHRYFRSFITRCCRFISAALSGSTIHMERRLY